MILYEFEGKQILKKAGLNVPNSQLVTSGDLDSGQARMTINTPFVLKAQVLSGKRADVGGIISIKGEELSIKEELGKLFGKTINNEKVEKILVEEMVEFEGGEYYVSVSYDTDKRGPILSISESGGTGIEERGFRTFPINPLTPNETLKKIESEIPTEVLEKIVQAFFNEDCLLLEINPLVKVKSMDSRFRGNDNDGVWVALDAKVKLDDVAAKRHTDWSYPPRSVPGYNPTKGEIAAKKIDEEDYRGTAGSSYFDLDGDIAVLSSGGGVSLTALDSLINLGGKPANFTEYSGNPPKEKVVKLTKIVLDKPNIHGLWVIGTVVANFTDIYETLSGLIEGLREAQTALGKKFDFPIVIRRGGPRDDEAFAMLREVKDFNLVLQGPETSIGQSAKVIAQLASEYEGSRLRSNKNQNSSSTEPQANGEVQ
jgi:citryl-CoA synthetase large subunit